MKKLILLSILMLPLFNLMAEDDGNTYTKVVDETVQMLEDVTATDIHYEQWLFAKDGVHYMESY